MKAQSLYFQQGGELSGKAQASVVVSKANVIDWVHLLAYDSKYQVKC